MKKEFTVTIYAPDFPGLLARVMIILSRKRVSVASINSTFSKGNNLQILTFVIKATLDEMEKIEKLIKKQIGVVKVVF